MDEIKENFLTLKRASNIYGINITKLRAAISNNELPCKWIARAAYVSRLQLEAWIDRQPGKLDPALLPKGKTNADT